MRRSTGRNEPGKGQEAAVRHLSSVVAFLLLIAFPALPGPSADDRSHPVEVSFYAAASLRDVLQDLAPRCESSLGVRLVFNFGASNDLARQIIAAVRADVFFSADEAWMDRVVEAGLADTATRRSLLSNRLVVVAPADTLLRLTGPAELTQASVRRIALANPEAVPAGKYARAWLEKAGLWVPLSGRVVPSLDVRAALAAVESGAADVGIVYRTDATISKKLRILYEVSGTDGPRISYALAALKGHGDIEAARRVVAWLAGPEAAGVFERHGFIVLAPPA
jgi:molybdate transport system substrate-binding protein